MGRTATPPGIGKRAGRCDLGADAPLCFRRFRARYEARSVAEKAQ